MLRILNVICSIDPSGGGVIEAARSFSSELMRRGHRVDFVCLDDPKTASLFDGSHQVHALGPGGSGYRYNGSLSSWVVAHKGEYDVAILHSLWNHASIGGRAGLVAAGIPYLYFTHGMLDIYFNSVQPVKKWAKQLFWLALQNRVLADAHAVLFTTHAEQEASRFTFFGGRPYRSEIVPLGIEGEPVSPSSSLADFDDLRQLVSRPYLLFLSRIHPKKGIDLLIEGFARYADRLQGYDLVVAGPDPSGIRTELMQRVDPIVSARIHWTGMVTGARKWALLRHSSAFILPSHQENFGIAVAEAAACGIPILTTNKVNIHATISENGAGVVADDTAAGLARLLDCFAALSQAERTTMGQAARKCFMNEFSIEAATDRLEHLLIGAARQTEAHITG
ncbi:glycosyltransferase [Bradyrhizobium sp. 179]|uniref:glycosyltransferase n=1 Tax=Bradyrhizobium sp. 179 TaxID=2782648 RepID=UPI001FFA6A02|nr:glycosyltransferase [Bradyrhizobium sp. 179]